MVIIDTVINTLLRGLTLDPAGMHCPSWDDAFVSSFCFLENIRCKFPNLVATPTDGTMKRLERCKAHQIL